jgi:hypothetical protein
MAFDPKRSATSGRFVLEVDDTRVAYLKKFSGLHYEGDVGTNDHGPLNMQTKQLTNYKFAAGKASVGIAQSGKMYDWIRASFRKEYATKSGAFIAGDFNYKATHRIDFMNALITEVTIPKFDGTSKDPGYIDITFEAEDVRHTKANGEDIRGDYGTKQKTWLPSMFRFELSGLEDACHRIATIDSFTWKQSIVKDAVGAHRIYTAHPAKVVVPEVKLAISSADHDPWRQWAESWFIGGKCLASDHKSGAIIFLSPDMETEICRVELKGVGLKKFADEDHEANSEKIKRFTVELYVEEMDLIMEAGARDV